MKKRAAKKKTKAAQTLGRRLKKKRAAARELGVTGDFLIGKTAWLTPTSAGFRALDSFLLERQRSSKKRERDAFSFEIELRYRGPDGKIEPRRVISGGFPRLTEARRRRKRGESEAAAFRRLTELSIKKAIFRAVEGERDIRGNSDSMKRSIKGKSTKAARAAIRRFKSERALTFRVGVILHVI
jgi:hypothetical protein